MKKIFIFLIVIFLLIGCYDEYIFDNTHTTVGFANTMGGSGQPGVLHRTIVKGEGLKLDAGVYVAGLLKNNKERWAEYEIDPSILAGTEYELMPENYYSLSNNNRFIIPAGELVGRVTIMLDSALFVNDINALDHHYAIPFRITRTSEDSIHSTFDTQILAIKYINYYEGYYYHKYTYTNFGPDGIETHLGTAENILIASTVMLDTVRFNGMMNVTGVGYMMDIHVDNDNVFLKYFSNPQLTGPNPVEMVTPTGENYYNRSANTFTLNYRVDYPNQDNYTNVSATLVWRNRVRDGVNEWRR